MNYDVDGYVYSQFKTSLDKIVFLSTLLVEVDSIAAVWSVFHNE